MDGGNCGILFKSCTNNHKIRKIYLATISKLCGTHVTRDIVVIIRFFSLLMNSIPTIYIVSFCKMDSLSFAIRCAMDK